MRDPSAQSIVSTKPKVPGLVQSPVADPYVSWAQTHRDANGPTATVRQIKQDVRAKRVAPHTAADALDAIGEHQHGETLRASAPASAVAQPVFKPTLNERASMQPERLRVLDNIAEKISYAQSGPLHPQYTQQMKSYVSRLRAMKLSPEESDYLNNRLKFVADRQAHADREDAIHHVVPALAHAADVVATGGLVGDIKHGRAGSAGIDAALMLPILRPFRALKALRAARDVEEAGKVTQTAEEATHAARAQEIRDQVKAIHADPASNVGGKLTAEAAQRVHDLESELVQHLPSTPTAFEQAQQGLRGARSVRGKQEAAYSAERGSRAQSAARAMEQTPGLAGHYAAKAALGGELPKINFGGFTELTPDALDALTQHIQSSDLLMPYQKIRAVDALVKAQQGHVPTPGEITLLENVFGKGSAQSLVKQVSTLKGNALDVLNAPRTAMSSMDVSAVLRRGLVAAGRHPIIVGRNIPAMFKVMKSDANFEALLNEVQARPTYHLMDQGGLAITDLGGDLNNREEQVMSRLLGKIPGISHSQRAYTGFLVKTRADVFDQMIRLAQAEGRDVQDPKLLKSIANYINAATGRGELSDSFQRAAPLLNGLFFSPRLMASRINFLNPAWYMRQDPFVRKHALRAALQTFGAVASTLELAHLAGADVGLDPTSADFGKIKLGNTRLDIAGGFQQYFHLLGEISGGWNHFGHPGNTSSTTGTFNAYGSGFGQKTPLDAVLEFGESKFSPPASFVKDLAGMSSGPGQPFSLTTEAKSRFLPLIAQDAHDLYNEHHGGMNGIEAALAGYGVSAFGIGLQTYGPTNNAAKPTSKLAQQAKDAGMPPPPKVILTALARKADLDALSRQHRNDPQSRLDAYLRYYAQTTGDHSYDDKIGAGFSDAVAAQGAQNIRDALIDKSLYLYETTIRERLAAQGKTP